MKLGKTKSPTTTEVISAPPVKTSVKKPPPTKPPTKPAAKKPQAKKPRLPKPTLTADEDDDDGLDFSSLKKSRLRLPAPTRPPANKQNDVDDEDGEDTEGSSSVRLLPGVSKRTLRRLNSMFGQRSDAIIDLLETTDTDGAASLITRTMLQTLVDVLPVVERGVRTSKGSRGVMPMNQVISQIREMCHDLQAYKDRSLLGQSLVDRTIRPAFLDLAVQVSTMFVEMDSFCKTRMNEKDFERFHEFSLQLKRSLADYIHKQYHDISSTIVKSM